MRPSLTYAVAIGHILHAFYLVAIEIETDLCRLGKEV